MRAIDKTFTIPERDKDDKQHLIADQPAVFCATYSELRKNIARLACANPDFILFYRGQQEDFVDKNYPNDGSSFFPSIYRGAPTEVELKMRWFKLSKACEFLREELGNEREKSENDKRLKRELNLVIKRKLLQWSILQHYEVVETPLLDVTQSLRVACSFAVLNNTGKDAYIYVFAMPYYIGRISINSEYETTNIRLLSIAPAESLRPHYQEGFLLGEDQIEESPSRSRRFDFRRRLVGKFRIPNNNTFWENKSTMDLDLSERALTYEELYPTPDLFINIRDRVKNKLNVFMKASVSTRIDDKVIGNFIHTWIKIENLLKKSYIEESGFTAYKAIRQIENSKLRNKLNYFRNLRNEVAHNGVPNQQLSEELQELDYLEIQLQEYLNSNRQ